jgi:putative endonuclease
MNCYYTYILFSTKLNQYYIGSTNNLERRLNDHNTGQSKHTSKGMPWIVVFTKEFATRVEAVGLEMSIKKRGAARYLSNLIKG